MNRRVMRVATSVLVTLVISPFAGAQTSPSANQGPQIDRTQVAQSDRMAAEAWGLNEQEYRRYQTLMEGPRGIWSPNLDPLTALGIAARSAAERKKYAEMLVRTERQRVKAELAFQRAYDAAWQRLYPNSMPVDPFTTQRGADATASLFGNDTRDVSRLNVVVATQDCGQCDAVVKRLLDKGAAMDIWVVDAEGDDSRIRDWAVELGISPNQVREGHITLNHGGSLSIDATDLPRVAPRG